jgi:peptide/nickel transport system substrate-binding protein
MQRRTFLTVTLLSTIGLTARAATRGGTLVYGRQTDCIYLDPVHTAQNADIWVSLNLYDTLTQPTNDGKSVVPGLASSWETSQDGKVMTFKLRPNLRFADGSPLTVDDVKWSLERAANKETGGQFQFLLASIEGVERQGTDSVILRLKHSDPTMLKALATFNAGIVPSKLIMAEPGTTLDDKSKSFAQHPIGSGPFTMKSWNRNSEMVMTRNPYYWTLGSDGQPLPYLDAVRYVIIPDDATRVLKLKAGEIDAAEFIPYSRVAELKADPRLNMVLFPAAQVHYFTMNNRPTLKDGTKNPLSDLRVRQALNYGTDKQALIQVITYAIGTPEQSFMPMSTPLSFGSGPLYPYDLNKAKELLAQSAWARGFEITLCTIAGNADDVAKATALQQMWAPLGVRLKVEQMESATRIARYNAADFQMLTSLWTNDINDPNEIASLFCYYPTIQNRHSGWDDPVMDQLFLDSQQELDPAKRAAQYKEIQERYFAHAPIIFGYEVPYPVAMAKKVKNFVQIPLGNNLFVGTYLSS